MAAERFEQAHWKLDRQKILPLLGAAQKGSPPYYLDLQAGRDKEKWLPRRFIEPLTRALAAMTCVLAVFLFSSHLYLVHEKKQLLEQKRAISLWKDRLFQHRRTEQSIHTLTELLSEAEKRTLSWHTLLTELGTSLPSECVLKAWRTAAHPKVPSLKSGERQESGSLCLFGRRIFPVCLRSKK